MNLVEYLILTAAVPDGRHASASNPDETSTEES